MSLCVCECVPVTRCRFQRFDVGYVGDGVNCQFVGLCAVNNGGCHPLATCRESPGMMTSTYLLIYLLSWLE